MHLATSCLLGIVKLRRGKSETYFSSMVSAQSGKSLSDSSDRGPEGTSEVESAAMLGSKEEPVGERRALGKRFQELTSWWWVGLV